jgi:hypothetical protein
MAIANITNNILTDSGVATSALQIALNGTGFVKIVGTTISYDNSTYLTTSAAASTYVALTGNQTIAGVKTFSNNSKFDGALILKNNVSSSLAGYVGLSALSFSGNKGINIDFDTYSIGFYFNGTLPYNYTFPNANGTVALTSDIPDVSGYVTLITAQTITGAKTFTSALNGTSATFSSSVTANSNLFVTNGSLNFGGTATFTSTDPAIYRVAGNDLAFAIGSTERMRITSGGNVLIGTSTDGGYKLYVDGGSSNGMAFYSTSPANQFKIAGSAAAMTFTNTIASPSMGGSLGVATSAGDFLSGTAAGDTIFINQFSGKKLYAVSYSGGVYLSSGATSWTANSDIRLKNINSHIENAVEKLSTLQTINFSYKDDKFKKQNLGLIAQEVEKIFPELIDKNDDGMLGVRYTELVPVLVKAIQEQQKEINELKQLINK